MFSFIRRIPSVDWAGVRRDGHNLFTKLIRTRDPRDSEMTSQIAIPGRNRLSRCLTTMDLTSLGVGSCVGTGMYLVSGMVARKFAGPGVVISFIIAALASIFSGACYAEFGVRVPNTTGSAYMYSYVTVGEFIAFVIGWNMILEYLIGTSACARALSACFTSLWDDGTKNQKVPEKSHTAHGKSPDFVAFGITLSMMFILVAGVRKSLLFNNLLNAINFSVWVFIIAAGLFYVDFANWTEHHGFLPYGWSGVFSGAATCFYAFIGFDIIATTGEEANNPKRSIPLAIVCSLGIILVAYVSISMILTLIVPYDEVDTDSALVQMFAHVNAPTCKYIVGIGALAGLTVSMFGSMFPMPRIVYAMASDGLIFKKLGSISEESGTPRYATICGGIAAAIVALLIQLEVLVEMMSIGTLLAYTLVSSCVLVLRYQPHSTNLVELLPQSLRTPVDPEGTATSSRQVTFAPGTAVIPVTQRVMVRRVTRSSPDSDDTLPGDESEDYVSEDAFLVNASNTERFYVGGGSSGNSSMFSRFFSTVSNQLMTLNYLCPGLFPWVDLGPATDESGMFVIKAVGIMYVLIIVFDLFAAYGNPGTSNFTNVTMLLLMVAIIAILINISRRPQNRMALIYATPGLPFVPTIAIIVNIYLILNLSVLTLVRFTIWMIIGLVVYFQYGIKNSTLETNAADAPADSPPPPNPLDRTTIPPSDQNASRPNYDRNIFEGDGIDGPYGNLEFSEQLLSWHESNLLTDSYGHIPNPQSSYLETRYDQRTNITTTTRSISRPPWAYPDSIYEYSWTD